ncbi:hypothetical protein EVAR_41264_1 [Eumeta japonica]|uniref:Uncharacterized protein n=1 Tax=Eumeta variegata TaxID=151549 RepID=A0A4C1XAL9_EUMVA|nr:hypothetical protein EVAR_41264_1 [Eumeta japonica]
MFLIATVDEINMRRAPRGMYKVRRAPSAITTMTAPLRRRAPPRPSTAPTLFGLVMYYCLVIHVRSH